MDFNALHKPYEGEDSPSPEAQMKWLQKMGIPHDIASRAILQVYTMLEQGKKFEETTINGRKYSAGWNLCQFILAVAKDLHQKTTAAYLEVLARQDEAQREKIREDMLKATPKTFWQRTKAVFSNPYKEIK